MATIEERADKAMRERSATYLQPINFEFKDGYVKGATEQKEKAQIAFCKYHCTGYKENGKCSVDFICEPLQEFIRLMEE